MAISRSLAPMKVLDSGKIDMRGRIKPQNPHRGKTPTYERIRELFDYREDGELITLKHCHCMSRRKIGEIPTLTTCTEGYRQISVDGKLWLLHRLIWLWHHGYLPEHQLDHINRDRTDNRIENLREVSHSCNTRNSGARASNKTGVKGVVWRRRDQCYSATIRTNPKIRDGLRHLYQGPDVIEATCHRYAAEQCLDWHACDLNSSAAKFLKQQGVLK